MKCLRCGGTEQCLPSCTEFRLRKRRPCCQKCRIEGLRNEKWDVYFCPQCLTWLEKKCRDPECHFCSARPDRPPPVQGEQE